MADEREKVEYQFTGDTSSLSSAVKKAIGLLDQYSEEIKKVAKTTAEMNPGIDRSIRAASNGFDKLISKAKQAATEMSKAFKSNNNLNDLSNPVVKFSKSINQSVAQMHTMFDPIIQKMQAFKMKASNTFTAVSKLVGQNAAAFRRSAKAVDKDSDSSNRNAKITKTLQNAKQRLGQAMKKLPQIFNQATKSASNFGTSIGKAATKGLGLKSIFATLTGYELSKFFATGIKEALHYVEVLNMFTVVTGESNDAMKEFVNTIQEWYGLDTTSIMEMTSEFYNLATAVDTPAAAAEQMSRGLTATALNISSLFDVDIKKVSQDLTSGMQGMTRAVRKYGLDLRMATLEQTALAYGLKIDADTTSEANRQALRYLTIVRQASRATGDFAKTIESPANQLRILKEQFAQLARSIGNFFLPVLQKVLPYLNGIIMAIRTILQFIAKLMNIGDISFGGMTDAAKDLEDTKKGVSGIGDAADKTKKKVKDLLAPFDELNILNEQKNGTSAGGAGISDDFLDPALAKALEDMEIKLDKVRMKANDVRDAILGFLGLSVDDEGNVTEVIGGYFNRIKEALKSQDYYEVGSIVAEVLNEGLYWALDNLNWNTLGTKIKHSVDVITGLYNGFMQNFDWSTLGKVIGNGLNIAIYTAQDFVAKLDWTALGSAFANEINGIVTTVDWAALAQTLSDGLAGLLTTIYTWLETTDWEAIGAAVGTFVCNINWTAVAKAIFETIGAAFGAVAATLWGLLKEVWKGITSVWNDTAQEDGAGVITSFFQGIINTLVDVATWIYNNIIKPFVNGIKKGFGISGKESTVTKDLGKKTADGFLSGLKTIFSGVSSWISELSSKVINGLNGILSSARSIASSIASTIASAASSAASAVQEVAEKAKANGKDKDTTTKTDTKKSNTTKTNTTKTNNGGKKNTKKMATGGVVTSPTYALIGEGRYPEAVMPLGGSPQMQDLIQQIVDAIDNKPDSGNTPIQVTMSLDGRVLYKSVQKASRDRGVNFKMGAFER